MTMRTMFVGAAMGMIALSGQPQAETPAYEIIAALQEVREIGRALDAETEVLFVHALLRATRAANALIDENFTLLQNEVTRRVAEIRASGDCVPAEVFDAAGGLPADLRCPN